MNFHSEKIGHKNSSAHELLSKKYFTFFTIHCQEWRQIFEPTKTISNFHMALDFQAYVYIVLLLENRKNAISSL